MNKRRNPLLDPAYDQDTNRMSNRPNPLLGSEEDQLDFTAPDNRVDIDLSYGADERNPDESLEAALVAHDRRNGVHPAQGSEIAPTDASENTELVNPRHGGDLEITSNEEHGPLLKLAVDLGVSISNNTQELVNDAAHDMAKAATLLVRSGVQLLIAKEQCQHGEFENFLEGHGISSQRASEAMNYAKFASQLDPKERSNYLLLPKKSALVLANADPVVVGFLLDDENIELARKVRKKSDLLDLSRELVETTDQRDKLQKEVAALYEENKSLKSANEAQIAGSEYPAFVVQLRKESSVLADEAIAALSSIRTHAETFNEKAAQSDVSRHDMTRMMEAAMYPALGNIASVLHTANKLLIDVCAEYDLSYEDIAGRIHTLPDHELQIIDAARDSMLNRKAGKAAARQGQYVEQGEVTRGRGRPKKA